MVILCIFLGVWRQKSGRNGLRIEWEVRRLRKSVGKKAVAGDMGNRACFLPFGRVSCSPGLPGAYCVVERVLNLLILQGGHAF